MAMMDDAKIFNDLFMIWAVLIVYEFQLLLFF